MLIISHSERPAGWCRCVLHPYRLSNSQSVIIEALGFIFRLHTKHTKVCLTRIDTVPSNIDLSAMQPGYYGDDGDDVDICGVRALFVVVPKTS